MIKLTVGKLKEALKGVPDDVKVILSSDSGLDQCPWEDHEIVLEGAFYHHYKLPNGEVFEDTGDNEVSEFWIYGNYREVEDEIN